jgi:F0F1-type ATP synthase assembly protein I
MENNNGFKYTYSAEERDELKRIRDKYAPCGASGEDSLERMRRLDNRVTGRAQSVSLAFGVIGALLLGFGMSLIMTDLALSIGITSSVLSMLLGIILGIVGGILASLAYPVYNAVTRHERAKVRDEIIKLSDELLG